MFSSFWRGLDAIERRFVIGVVATHLLLITLPYLWALEIAPPGYEYSGLLYNPDDQNVHLSWARQAAAGQFFTRDLFTTESLINGERPLFFNALTALMGVLSLSGLPLVCIYHALRLLFSAATLLGFYALSTHLTNDRRVRIVALLLAAFSSGAGYLAPFFVKTIFIDRPDGSLMMPEAFIFTSSFIFTLNIASLALLVSTYLCVLQAHGTGDAKTRRRAMGLGFFSALLLSNIHTYDAIPLIFILLIWTAISRSSTPVMARWRATGIIWLGATLPMIYQFIVFRNSEEFRVKALTRTPAPALPDVLLSYGFLIPLALIGGVLLWRHKPSNQPVARLLIVWALVTLTCIYLPVSFARKMIEGFHLPLCLLAAFGLIALLSQVTSRPMRRCALTGVLALYCVSSVQFVMWCLDNARENNASRARFLMPPLYLTSGDAAALRFLRKGNEHPNRAVLCLPFLGNYIPRETGRFVYVGHWAETLDLKFKLGEATRFYSGQMSSHEATAWLRNNHIEFVVIGTYEKQLGARMPLELRSVFTENGTTIYAAP